MKPLTIIKVPEGCRRMSASVGISNEVIYYFRLKSVRVDGYFKGVKGVLDVTSRLGITERTARRWFSKLISCGLMYKGEGGYGLVSYNKLYTILGFNMNPNKKNTRLGTFKIFKINSSHADALGSAITREEIKLNQYRQEYMQKKPKATPIGTPDKSVAEVRGTSISCAGVAKLLGYKSASSGHFAENLLSKYNLATVTKHLEVIEVGAKQNTRKIKGNGRFYLQDGILFKVMPNQILFN